MARNRIATATNGDDEENNDGTKDFPAASPKRAILFFIFLIQNYFSIFGFRLPRILKQKIIKDFKASVPNHFFLI